MKLKGRHYVVDVATIPSHLTIKDCIEFAESKITPLGRLLYYFNIYKVPVELPTGAEFFSEVTKFKQKSA
jgi:hypothetical protein